MNEAAKTAAGIRQLVMDVYRNGLGLETSVEEKEAMTEVLEGINEVLRVFAQVSMAQSLGVESFIRKSDDDD